ncbi:retrovirus-related pol polyprotein from transposon TNT 1-94 [Tanacetum coccineum]
MTATKALIAIQEMADHSQKWHDKGSFRSMGGSRSDRISVIINKLSDIGERNETTKSTSVNGTFTDKVKRRIVEEQEKIPANELPPKEKDSGSFFLPCIISNMVVSNALADLGASISIMPFSLFKHLGLGKPKPIRMLIEMAEKSMQSPKAIIKNVLVKIDRFISPVDFVILDIVEDDKVPIILGRHSLACPCNINVSAKNLLESGEEKVDVVIFRHPQILTHGIFN